ncbi:type II toxin-antitoxin system YhaV family toxin [Noviherbaspirillum sedimenti]|uniref:Type II toxin-antitoxin system YhaV family toxin n=1 Tax=Noviherbaspirillum sedimenti TaxID=2320865 RepID=A0A3A3GH33_9BURK|nr:type II toxin-antitoxin system YhaV family toxin [Noviherbaspirillum sedimenti]RJG00210.1 type II toxin-antitoxin system YhaV family toxin [Noviherbaspirillum sedimenti]
MRGGKPAPLVVNGWAIFAHPLFLAQLGALTRQVEALKQKDPAGYMKKNVSKRLAAISRLAFEVIPQDPARPEYRQGNALGEEHKHWFRAKFFQQYRLFFRYHASSKVIVFAWVNDEDTKRAYESSDDAYRVFRRMLESGHPPDEWDRLLAESRSLKENSPSPLSQSANS